MGAPNLLLVTPLHHRQRFVHVDCTEQASIVSYLLTYFCLTQQGALPKKVAKSKSKTKLICDQTS